MAEIAIRSDVESFGNGLRFLGGCGIGVALWLAASKSLATRIAAAAAVMLVLVVLVLSGVLSRVLTNSVSEQALVRAEERAKVEANLVEKRADVAVSQASFIAKVLGLADQGQNAVKTGDSVVIGSFLEQLKIALQPGRLPGLPRPGRQDRLRHQAREPRRHPRRARGEPHRQGRLQLHASPPPRPASSRPSTPGSWPSGSTS